MKHVIRAVSLCLVVFGLFLSFGAAAQTHTPKYVSMSATTKAYFEYLPEGYDPNGTTTYPLILFMTGIGEFGSGSATQLPLVLKHGIPKLIQNGVFPNSFTAGGATHRFIVITPQWVTSPRPTATDMNVVLDYIVAHYKVNLKRIYITGLSYGGGLSFAFAGNSAAYAGRVAAIVPTAAPFPDGGDSTIYARSRVIATGNVPVWATHNEKDRQPDSSTNTISYISYINQTPAPNPLARKTIFAASGHDSWTKTYDPNFRENGYTIYEWMLLHEKGTAPPTYGVVPTASAGPDKTATLPTSSVTLSGSGTVSSGSTASYSWTKVSGPATGVISSPSSTSTTITGLTAGTYVFRLTISDAKSAKGVDDVKVTVNPAAGTKTIQVNIYGGSSAYSSTAWNNWNIGTTAASNKTSAAFKYIDGVTVSTVTATLSATTALKDNNTYYTGDLGAAPAGVLRHASQHNATRLLTLQGLTPAKKYDLEFYASYSSILANDSTIFKINGARAAVYVGYNKLGKAAFTAITPDAQGQLVVTIEKTGTYNYLNGFVLSENTGAVAPTVKYVKTNLYGGTNPYTNAEWNNWNVVSSLSVAALKYSDATASSINAALSSSIGVSDNGTTYGGTMAPAEVLRFCTGATTQRNFTLSGLSLSKTYSLELYASRAKTGYATIFTIGGTSKTVVTDNNKSNAVTFTGLVPNSAGQIIVSLVGSTTTNPSAYNYLNGFILTETTSGTTAVTINQAPAIATTEEAYTTAAIGVFPNPVSSQLQLRITNPYNGQVQVQVTDATGKIRQNLRFVKSGTTLQQTVSVAALPAGLYFVQVQLGAQRQTIKIVKQ
ncbi:MAG TPA: T9SS type A sorting domain-containing protein [Chitinophagaceae bacterium]|nr:T9SS type A sorting domain-containing protein [Chitinophagaceae bacterium]